MAENKKSFIGYCDWIEIFEELGDTEAGKLVKHLLRYVNDLNPQTEDREVKLCFIQIKQSLKRDLKKYNSYIDKQKSNGLKGGRPKKEETQITQITQPFILKPKKTDSVSVSDSDSVSDSVSESVSEINTNTIPTFEDFKKHALARKTNLDLKDLELKYFSWIDNDWSITRNGKVEKIKNWKSTLTNTVKWINESYKIADEPIEENLQERAARLTREEKAKWRL